MKKSQCWYDEVQWNIRWRRRPATITMTEEKTYNQRRTTVKWCYIECLGTIRSSLCASFFSALLALKWFRALGFFFLLFILCVSFGLVLLTKHEQPPNKYLRLTGSLSHLNWIFTATFRIHGWNNNNFMESRIWIWAIYKN